MSAAADTLFGRGESMGRFTVTTVVAHGKHAMLVQGRDEDGSFVAVKRATSRVGEELVAYERRVLDQLEPAPGVPRLVDDGADDRESVCVTGWVEGAEARVAAAECVDRRDLLDLSRTIVRGYAALHEQDVVHGQVHPRHVLVDFVGRVTLLDFSSAGSPTGRPPAARLEARFGSLSAPEHAAALLAGRRLQLTPWGEQFSVAALLYLLVTGKMYAPLRLVRDVLPLDVVNAAPSPFAAHGVEPWPELERVLARALHQDPSRRYDSTAAFAAALDDISVVAATGRRTSSSAALAGVLGDFREAAFSEGAIESLAAPTCSINFGAAGIAFALTRLGNLTGDRVWLEQAERWLGAAEARASEPDAFDDGDELTPASVGLVSPFHTASGVVAARAFLSEATGDVRRWQTSLDEYRAATAKPCANLDLTLGRSSVLLVAALLLRRADPGWAAARRLAEYGDELSRAVWRDAAGTELPYNGIAHGWGGLAYASLMWSCARGLPPPPETRHVLEMLAGLAEPLERGARWPVRRDAGPAETQFWPGWCHGNAGYAFLWTLAESAYGDGTYDAPAEHAAHLAYGLSGVSSLCCGTAGQAYSLLARYRATGDERWRFRATQLARQSAERDELAADATSPLSLYKGHVGLALLAAELDEPGRATMPMFEFEPGPRGET